MTTETVTVHIMGKDYQVSCPDHERNSLMSAATELDKRMRDIRQSGNVIGVERIAVMTALNLAHDLLQGAGSHQGDQELLADLHQRLDQVLD